MRTAGSTERPLSNGPAYDAYLESAPGLSRAGTVRRSSGHWAICSSALAMVGDAAPFYVGLGTVYANYAARGACGWMNETIQQAEQYAQKALTARARFGGGAHPAGLGGHVAREDQKDLYRLAMDALSLSPSNTDASLLPRSSLHSSSGRRRLSGRPPRTLLQVDPLSPFSHLTIAAGRPHGRRPRSGRPCSPPARPPTASIPTSYLVRWWHNLALVGEPDDSTRRRRSVDRWVDGGPGTADADELLSSG